MALSACGGDEGGSGGSGAGGSASSGDSVSVAAADVPEGGGLVEGQVVVTQPSAGEFKAFDGTCPHQGCAVAKVESGTITCPCHGSTFDASTGDVTGGPAQKGLTAKEATVDGDTVTVIKDLKVMGSSLVVKVGTKVRNIRLVGGKVATPAAEAASHVVPAEVNEQAAQAAQAAAVAGEALPEVDGMDDDIPF